MDTVLHLLKSGTTSNPGNNKLQDTETEDKKYMVKCICIMNKRYELL